MSAFGWTASPVNVVRIDRADAGGIRIAMEALRDAIHRAIDRAEPGPSGAIVRAFATGDTSGLQDEAQEAFRRSGLSHLLAVSGLNLAIISGLFVIGLAMVLRRIPAVSAQIGVHRLAAGLALPFVFAYTLVVGASPSAVRAAWMVTWVLLARIFRRRPDTPTVLAVAGLGLLAVDPWALDDPSTQLSFSAVAGLLWVYPALSRRLPASRSTITQAALDVVVASVAATLATLPIVAAHFQRISWIGVVANVPAAPLSSFVLVPLALVGGLVGIGWPSLADPILAVAAHAATVLNGIAEVAAWVPGGTGRLPTFGLAEATLYYAALGLSLSGRMRTRGCGFAVAAGLTAAMVAAPLARRGRDDVTVTFLPVGQGDAVVVELPRGHTMLVDTGPAGARASAVERVVLPYLRHRGISRIDWLVLTHPHADHVGGLDPLFESIPVGEIWWNGDRRESGANLLAPVIARGPPSIRAPHRIRVGTAQIHLLAPDQPAAAYSSVNDASVVVLIEHGRRRILLTGDVEAEAEARLVSQWGQRLQADVLKLGHHGSRTSSTEAFLDRVRPTHAVVSAGLNNHFGFPHPSVVERLKRRTVQIWRTDVDGAITVWTDGDALRVWPFVDRKPRQPELQRRFGRIELFGRGRLKRPIVETAGSGPGHPREEVQLVRQHVARQPPGELLENKALLSFGLLGHDEQHQLVAHVRVGDRNGRRILDRSLGLGDRFDLAEVDPIPANFDQPISPSSKDKLASGVVDGSVPGAKHRLLQNGLQGVQDKRLVGAFRGVPVARRDRGAHDQQLAFAMGLGHHLAFLVEQDDVVVFERPADRHRLVFVGNRCHAVTARQPGFGLPVDVHHLGAGGLLAEHSNVAPGHRLTREDDGAQAADIVIHKSAAADQSHQCGGTEFQTVTRFASIKLPIFSGNASHCSGMTAS